MRSFLPCCLVDRSYVHNSGLLDSVRALVRLLIQHRRHAAAAAHSSIIIAGCCCCCNSQTEWYMLPRSFPLPNLYVPKLLMFAALGYFSAVKNRVWARFGIFQQQWTSHATARATTRFERDSAASWPPPPPPPSISRRLLCRDSFHSHESRRRRPSLGLCFAWCLSCVFWNSSSPNPRAEPEPNRGAPTLGARLFLFLRVSIIHTSGGGDASTGCF